MVKSDYETWSNKDLIKEIKKLRKRKKYGIVWDKEKTPEKVVMECRDKLPVLKETKNKEIITDKNKPINLLIEGDNYHSLSVLNYTHKGRVDVIYIDPPYNTGAGEFTFNDKIVDVEDSYRHSKWLSFMSKRLRLSKNVLKSDGTIFVSIDDNELFQLKLLMDDIFGESNFRNCIIARRGTKSVQAQFKTIDSLSKGHEYILMYTKTPKKRFKKFHLKLEERKIGGWNNHWRGTDRPTMRYALFGIKPKTGQWRWGRERSLKAVKNYQTMLKELGKTKTKITQEEIDAWYLKKLEETGKERIDLLRLSSRRKPEHYIPPTDVKLGTDLWVDIMANKSVDLVRVFGEKVFDNPKSIELIKRIVEFAGSKDSIILDFFAGSGTTGHAVLELNKDDGGNRKFILCTNNENGICVDVCYPRVERVIRGYQHSTGKKVKGFKGNLKYFKTLFVEGEPTDIKKKKLVDQSTEMLCLREDCFDKIKSARYFKIFKNKDDKYLGIVYDDDGIEPFKKEVKRLKKKINVYVFSLDASAREEEFEDVIDLVNLKPIPEVILNVYRRIFK